MSEMPSEPDTEASTPWGSNALTAGIVLAGVALGRGSKTGLAAGVLAAAGLRLLAKHSAQTKQHRPTEATYPFIETPKEEIQPAPEATPKDWLDSAAIYQTENTDLEDALAPTEELLIEPASSSTEISDPASATPPPSPVVLAEKDFDFPLGPMIWEQGNGPVSYSDAGGETVWYGLRESVEAPPEIKSIEPDTTEFAVEEVFESFVPGLEQLPPEPEVVPSVEMTQPEAAPPTETLEPLPLPEPVTAEEEPLVNKLSAFILTDDSEVDKPSAFIADALTHSTSPPQNPDPPPAVEMTAVPYIVAARPGFGEIIAKPPTRAAIPAKRSEGQAPRMVATDRLEDVDDVELGSILPLPQMPVVTPLAAEASSPAVVAPAKQHRSVEPMAPMMTASDAKQSNLFITVLAILAVAAIFTITWWKDGALLKHLRQQEWNQLVPVKSSELPAVKMPAQPQP